MPEKASNVASDGFLSRYGIFILFTRKVASRVKSDGLKAMLWCRVVLWENSKAGRVVLVLWAVGWFVGLVDGLSWWAVDRLKGLWISKGKTRVRELYLKKIIPKRTSVLCPWPAIFNTIFYHFQIKKWKLFSSKKIG